ncbi:hypothetical protein AMTR_s00205p00023380 [Amborella trichopoda]|uniref:Uncharacterized protein n=1 Tax=Amborella trichopoda TaxID=13333 RepID=W1P514_AMBTC|nr:hypothetical protein AMTR_s00205p00023380 [Amborella trichopoda]
MKIPFKATIPQHLPRGLVLASSHCLPPILVTESSSKEEDLSPRSRNWSQKPYRRMEAMEKTDKMLKSMKVEYTREIVVVDEAIPILDLNQNQALKRRPRRREVQRLLAEFSYDPLSAGPPRSPGVGKKFYMH